MSIRKPLLISLLLVAASVAHAADRGDDRDFAQTVKADARGSVRVSNVAGKVHVTGWDRSEVEVKASLSGSVGL